MHDEQCQELLSIIEKHIYLFDAFKDAVFARFVKDPKLNGKPPIIHSIKSRIKDLDHIKEKINRKDRESGSIDPITPSNVFERITDIAGIRIMHLFQQDFPFIHACVQDQINRGEWVLYEQPKAYTWDPESKVFFESFGLNVLVKESFYTSIHYVIRPRMGSELSCEIQVRTLFEEIWGEIDHQINYPAKTDSLACHEQLRVLARLVGAGSRLADAIYRIYREAQCKS
jgi:putative GTP pyrophosphokinase